MVGKFRFLSLLILACVFFGGCATRYQQNKGMLLSGNTGYTDTRTGEDTYKVSFAGNQYTQRDQVETYALYRCAEVTSAAGYDYFIITDQGSDTATRTDASASCSFGSCSGSSMTSNAITVTYAIKMAKGEKPADNSKAHTAKQVLEFMKDQVKR